MVPPGIIFIGSVFLLRRQIFVILLGHRLFWSLFGLLPLLGQSPTGPVTLAVTGAPVDRSDGS